MDSNSDMDITFPDLRKLATTATLDLLSLISRILFKKYNTFKDWRQVHNVENLPDNVMAYFSRKADNKYKSQYIVC